jgi:hypothetical protein
MMNDNCCAIAQAVSHWLPTAAPRVRARVWSCGVWWTKWYWGRISPSTSVSPANLHSTNCSTVTIIYHLWLVQEVSSGHSTKWAQSHPTKEKSDNEFSCGYKTDTAKHFINYKHIPGVLNLLSALGLAALSREHSGMGQVH